VVPPAAGCGQGIADVLFFVLFKTPEFLCFFFTKRQYRNFLNQGKQGKKARGLKNERVSKKGQISRSKPKQALKTHEWNNVHVFFWMWFMVQNFFVKYEGKNAFHRSKIHLSKIVAQGRTPQKPVSPMTLKDGF